METFKDKTAIVGIGVHKFSKDSGMTEWDMACRSTRDALDDAGLTPEDIDGMVLYATDDFDDQHLARAMGMGNIAYYADSSFGSGAACADVLRATTAVAAGAVNSVVFVRAVNDSSKHRATIRINEPPAAEAVNNDFHDPFGLMDNTGRAAMRLRRYIHEYGIDDSKFGWVATVCREHGANNPNSIFYKQPVTIEDYRKSKMIAEPIRALDCSPEIDGAVAFIITTVERAKRLRQQPVYITAGAQSMATGTYMMASYYRPAISGLEEIGNVGRKLFDQAGITKKDISLIQLDDAFAPFVPIQLEELGFCGKGEGTDFCEGGDRIRLGGELPLNTGGGSLGEGNIYGLNHICDTVLQLRGTAPNQVRDAEIALIATGAGGPASGLILRR